MEQTKTLDQLKEGLELLEVGSKVFVGEDIPALVTAICVRANNYVQYECTWWSSRENHTAWFIPQELKIP